MSWWWPLAAFSFGGAMIVLSGFAGPLIRRDIARDEAEMARKFPPGGREP